MPRPKVLTLVLAGGEGSRLEVLTEQRAKPAMSYAGNFRLIDISLSNALHSGLQDVWVVVQYRPHTLNEQLANGRPWDLDRTHGGLRVLPPREGAQKDGFAQGNADAIYQHLDLIREFGADEILVLSADHIYRLDYSRLLDHHRERGADLSMVVTEVAPEKASRFGVVTVDDDDWVTDFAYKPDDPETNLVTAEIFLYEADLLLDTLEDLAEEGDDALEDYGDALIPRLVESHRVSAFRLDGYWRDVGLAESYWQGHMDLLDPDVARGLFDDPAWPILTQAPQRLPARIRKGSEVENSLIAPGADVRGRVVRSVLSPGVVVEKDAVVQEAVLLRDARVRSGAEVARAVIDSEATVGRDARVGALEKASADDEDEAPLTLVGHGAEVEAGARVEAGEHVAPPPEQT